MKRARAFTALLACCYAACGPAAEPDAEVSWSAAESAPWGSGAAAGSWSYRPLPEPPGADYAVEVDLRVDAPADLEDPVHQVSRFANYNNQDDLGGYEAALVLRGSAAGHYRLMISTRWREALLWSSRGGILQVRPFDFQPGVRYRLRASAQGAQITLRVDDRPVLDYTDRTVPLPSGAPALARKEGASDFGAARLVGLPPLSAAPAPATHALTLRTWKGLRWGFDGDEPIFALGLPPNVSSVYLPTRLDCMAFEVKLVPGYSAQLYVPWYMQNWAGEIFSADSLKDLKVVEEGPRLKLELTCAPPAGRTDLLSRTEVTIAFNEAEGAYRYDHLTELTVPAGAPLRVDYPIDVTDPALLNGVPPGGPYGLQWPTTHKHSVYQQEGGGLYKLPHNHAGMYPGYVGAAWWEQRLNYLKADGGFWAMVGDPVANPVFRLLGPPANGALRAGPCGWAYDLHLEWEPEGTTLGPGTYAVRWQLGSVRGAQGDAWLQQGAFGAPGDLGATHLLYTGGVGHVERFDKVVLQASPFGEQPWGSGALQDRTVGHGDSTSLRLQGPGTAASASGDGHFTESFEPGRDYEVSVWVKTLEVIGEGPGVHFAGKAYYPGVRGTTDWQRIGFTVRPAGDLSMVSFGLHLSGAGTAWFDDFLIRPVSPASPPGAGLGGGPRPLTELGPLEPELLLRVDSSSFTASAAVLDQSGHGNHGQLLGDARRVLDAEAGAAIELSGRGALLFPGHPGQDFGQAFSMSFWLKLRDDGMAARYLLTGGEAAADLWRILLLGEEAPYSLDAQLPGGVLRDPALTLPVGAWTHLVLSHDGDVLRVYVDGRPLLTGVAPGVWLGRGAAGALRFGGSGLGDAGASGLSGRLANLRLYSRVLSGAEVAGLSVSGPRGP